MPSRQRYQRAGGLSAKTRDALKQLTRSLFLVLFLSSVVQAAPRGFEKGMNALLEGNFAEAYCQWKPLAHKGHAESQYNLGWLYANGNGLNVDLREAIKWWLAAAKQGHADAQFAIGMAFTTGEGEPRDVEQATFWFLRAARQGHRDSREILARLNSDPSLDLLAAQPSLLEEPWFGWPGVTTGERINVRANPSTKAKIVTKLDKGSRVRVLGRRGDWLQVALAEESGTRVVWIYHSLVRPSQG